MTPLIETVGVGKSYGSFVALDGVSLSISDGELVSIVGPNGAGKTTLVNVLTGLLKPTTGVVRFKGHDIAGIGPVLLAQRGMARAFQLVHIFPAMTVAETIAVAVLSQTGKSLRLFGSVKSDGALRAKVREVAVIFGLEGKLEAESRDWDAKSDAQMHEHHRWAQATTFLQIAIALSAIALLTRRNWLQWGVYGVAAVGGVLGALAIAHV